MVRHRHALHASMVALAATASLRAQTTVLVSVDSSGLQADGSCDDPALSDDARFVAFDSLAGNLAPSDNNITYDVFVRDRWLGTTEHISVNSNGVGASSSAIWPAISADGRYVAFTSGAWNLVTADQNNIDDVFVRDRVAGTTERVSVSSAGAESNKTSSAPRITGDGRFVAFDTEASTLVAGDSNATWDVFVHDRSTATTLRASLGTGGVQGNGPSKSPSMSSDGRYVAFSSRATNFVAGDTNVLDDVFVRDLQAGTTVLASGDLSGAPADGGSYAPWLSGDGRKLVFDSDASNLVAGDTNAKRDVFVRDLQAGTTALVSSAIAGAPSNGFSQFARISTNGRWVAFNSAASNLVAGDTNAKQDIFLRDLAVGTTQRVSVDSGGVQGNSHSFLAAITGDGRTLAFTSVATNLVAGDFNGARDVFVRERFLAPTAYCTAGTTTNGCAASIGASGLPSASATSGFTLSASSVEGQRSGLFFYGISGPVAVPWGTSSTSFLCVKTPTQRTPAQSSGGSFFACDGALTLDLLAFLAANPTALGQPIAMGQRFDAQAWFRDPPAPKTTNLSNAIEFDLVP